MRSLFLPPLFLCLALLLAADVAHAGGSTALAIPAAKDSFLRTYRDDRNEGANPVLVVGTRVDRRALVAFDVAGVAASDVQQATLVLSIRRSSRTWGRTGRTIDVTALQSDFTEGNGATLGVRKPTRGSGAGVTWHCATDADIANRRADCATPWNGGAIGEASASALVQNGSTGTLSFDVTADVRAGVSAWLVKLGDERRGGRVDFVSREGAAAAGTAARKSFPRSAATVAATWLCVTGATLARSPSGGVSGPSTAIQMFSAPATSFP
jgi:hypothetical protein